MSIHKDTSNLAEHHGHDKIVLLEGRRTELNRGGHVTYEVKVRVNNVNSSHQGIYQCAIEREFDKAYISSTITLISEQSLFPAHPLAELIACNRNAYDADKNLLTLKSGDET